MVVMKSSKVAYLSWMLLSQRNAWVITVFILFSFKMVKRDENYEEVSFDFYIKNFHHYGEAVEKFIKIERCGVHVFYVDADSYADATEMSPAGTKRSFSHDGEEGDGGPKRLK
ncbi:hypothetical protein PVK06_036836 [Gossypium arboreum]|uniref:Uncharacterized protein n=1 Tax=Gossypium arboreum TaxID=29729 RepID=A0ABR0NKL2_GOSAR|nr:hypothetical protein PVK06_036836 [Gossypium arboreum]